MVYIYHLPDLGNSLLNIMSMNHPRPRIGRSIVCILNIDFLVFLLRNRRNILDIPDVRYMFYIRSRIFHIILLKDSKNIRPNSFNKKIRSIVHIWCNLPGTKHIINHHLNKKGQYRSDIPSMTDMMNNPLHKANRKFLNLVYSIHLNIMYISALSYNLNIEEGIKNKQITLCLICIPICTRNICFHRSILCIPNGNQNK